MMQLTPEERLIVLKILENTNLEIVVFGSRARGTARKDSDLDLCVKSKDKSFTRSDINDLRQAFEDSDLPFVVDLVMYDDLPQSFHKKIDSEGIVLKPVNK